MRFASIFALVSLVASTAMAAPMCGLVSPNDASSSSPGQNSNSSNAACDVVASAWLPGWLSNFNLDSIPWNKYTHLTYSFAVTTNGPEMISLDKVDKNLLTQFVNRAKKENVLALVSVGGWTGSRYFSVHVQPDHQDGFVKALVNMASQYKLDGIDFDWEYPNKQGMGCNVISSDDSKNYLSFLQKLRQDPVGSKLVLTAAVGIAPFVGPDGSPMSDVSGFSKYLDHISIMEYDVFGSWSQTVGPNAPLDDSCAPQPQGSATSAVKAWTSAGFPANKVSKRCTQIALGVAAYGHSFHVDRNVALNAAGSLLTTVPFDKSQQPAGEGETPGTTSKPTDECGNTSGPSGIFNFGGMINAGYLQMSGNGTVTPANGMVQTFDTCSQTPFVYNPNTQVMISYDDTRSFAAKGQFINNKGLAGFAMWHAAGDTSQHTLISAISDAMGIEQVCN
ncbi:glycoside hydrolase family 18 protein [Amanita thiersii Skay4041]|uniref:Glycoside hydrolase family 18 protein n=1 Tax=Amanita thiersii Skay4041 TaxID=703135 RepID=A0A2A9NGK5_9AGAR|nr:glycoside hydrolase family 18 protein [Amanita thiersii Skay4041]